MRPYPLKKVDKFEQFVIHKGDEDLPDDEILPPNQIPSRYVSLMDDIFIP